VNFVLDILVTYNIVISLSIHEIQIIFKRLKRLLEGCRIFILIGENTTEVTQHSLSLYCLWAQDSSVQKSSTEGSVLRGNEAAYMDNRL
jgi:hypothetical protein